jgi:hypothetical protein
MSLQYIIMTCSKHFALNIRNFFLEEMEQF